MSKIVTATEAKNRLGALMAEAQDEPVIVEIRGAPRAAIISIDDLREFEALRDAEERRQRIEQMHRFYEQQAVRNADLSYEDATTIIEQATRDIREMRRHRGGTPVED
jgi:prevent-host-death family protein